MVHCFVDKDADLVTDELHAYKSIGVMYGSHQWVNHSREEYARCEIHNNTAESYAAMIERSKHGVFHLWRKKHLHRYLHEMNFRWNHREPARIKKTKKGRIKIVMKPLPVMAMLRSFLSMAPGKQVRRTQNGGIVCLNPA